MKMLRYLMVTMVCLLSIFLVFDPDVWAGRGGSRSSSSRSSGSFSRSSSSSKSQKSSKSSGRTGGSFKSKKGKDRKAVSSRANSKYRSKTDKAMAKKNNAAAKKYGTKANAQKEFRAKNKGEMQRLANKKYDYKDSKSAMANRPEHVPQTHTVGGNTYNTTYVGGQYGYMDGGSFMAYTAANMLVTSAMLSSHGYGQYNAYGEPVVVHYSSSGACFGWLFGVLGMTVIVILIFRFI